MKKVNIAGIDVCVESQAASEGVDFVVCSPAEWGCADLEYERGVCCKCARAVIFRPHAPKRPKRLCLPCADRMAESEDIQAVTTEQAISDIESLGGKVEREN